MAECFVPPPTCHEHSAIAPTVGQQLVDLKRAKDAGTLTDAEYEAQKSKVLNGR